MSKNKAHIAKVRIDEDTLKRWEAAANRSGLTLSAWMRLRIDGVEQVEVVTPRKAA